MEEYLVEAESISTESISREGIASRSRSSSHSLSVKSAHPPNYRILIAEDCPDNRSAMALSLKHTGADVVFATNGRECVDIALGEKKKGKPFDAIVVDVLMPIMDGFSAAMLLRENECSKLIISITERGMFCDEAESSQAGCDFHMSKSELYRQLIPAMREYL